MPRDRERERQSLCGLFFLISIYFFNLKNILPQSSRQAQHDGATGMSFSFSFWTETSRSAEQRLPTVSKVKGRLENQTYTLLPYSCILLPHFGLPIKVKKQLKKEKDKGSVSALVQVLILYLFSAALFYFIIFFFLLAKNVWGWRNSVFDNEQNKLIHSLLGFFVFLWNCWVFVVLGGIQL